MENHTNKTDGNRENAQLAFLTVSLCMLDNISNGVVERMRENENKTEDEFINAMLNNWFICAVSLYADSVSRFYLWGRVCVIISWCVFANWLIIAHCEIHFDNGKWWWMVMVVQTFCILLDYMTNYIQSNETHTNFFFGNAHFHEWETCKHTYARKMDFKCHFLIMTNKLWNQLYINCVNRAIE